MKFPVLEKRPIVLDEMKFNPDDAKLSCFMLDGNRIGYDKLSSLDLPHSWLQKETNRAKRFAIIPELLEATLEVDDFVWLTRDGVPTKIVKDRGEPVQYDRLLSEINQEFRGSTQPASYQFDETSGEIEITRWFDLPQKLSKRVGDELSIGARTRYMPMEVIDGSVMTRRLICTNGMSKVLDKHSFRGSGGTAESQIEFVVQNMLNASLGASQLVFQNVTLQLLKLPEGSDPMEFIEKLAKHYGFNEAQIKEIQFRYNADGDVDEQNVTQADILNAFTNALSHSPLFGRDSGRRRSTFHDIAGTIVSNISDNGFDLVDSRVPQLIAALWGQ